MFEREPANSSSNPERQEDYERLPLEPAEINRQSKEVLSKLMDRGL